jgi:hypothetical protein
MINDKEYVQEYIKESVFQAFMGFNTFEFNFKSINANNDIA